MISVSAKVRIQGGERAKEDFRADFYLYTDLPFDGGDTFLASNGMWIKGLNAGDEVPVGRDETVPLGTAEGTYHIIAVANYSNWVPDESDTDNKPGASSGFDVTAAGSKKIPHC